MYLSFALLYVGKQIKPLGINQPALFLSPQATAFFLQALETKKLNRAGYVYVLSNDSGRYRYLTNSTSDLLGNGVLIVGEAADKESNREVGSQTSETCSQLYCVHLRVPNGPCSTLMQMR